MFKKVGKFLELIKKFNKSLKFEIIEVGAHPYGAQKERFHILLDFFPDSKIHAFEVDENECNKLNKLSKKRIEVSSICFGR
jgi:hypothetical protein